MLATLYEDAPAATCLSRSTGLDRFNQPLSIRLSREQLKAVDALARSQNLRRGEYLRTLVQTAIDGTQPALTREELRHLSFISAGVDVLLTKLGGAEGQAAAQTTWNNNYAALTGTDVPPTLTAQEA
jgi:hypothetical protein